MPTILNLGRKDMRIPGAQCPVSFDKSVRDHDSKNKEEHGSTHDEALKILKESEASLV